MTVTLPETAPARPPAEDRFFFVAVGVTALSLTLLLAFMALVNAAIPA